MPHAADRGEHRVGRHRQNTAAGANTRNGSGAPRDVLGAEGPQCHAHGDGGSSPRPAATTTPAARSPPSPSRTNPTKNEQSTGRVAGDMHRPVVRGAIGIRSTYPRSSARTSIDLAGGAAGTRTGCPAPGASPSGPSTRASASSQPSPPAYDASSSRRQRSRSASGPAYRRPSSASSTAGTVPGPAARPPLAVQRRRRCGRRIRVRVCTSQPSSGGSVTAASRTSPPTARPSRRRALGSHAHDRTEVRGRGHRSRTWDVTGFVRVRSRRNRRFRRPRSRT